jgi:hypothetical protein
MIGNFFRIGGRARIPSAPFLYAHVQTDGSFTRIQSKTAVLLKAADGLTTLQKVTPIAAISSTEAEWASVYHGIVYALENNESAIALENDDFGVISAIITKRDLRHDYAKHYRNKITMIVGNTAWTGIRWIPREANSADDLF